jgi:NAD(P)-dependent dehydrogenase (short-subunit alcohol dehydrogenase family)
VSGEDQVQDEETGAEDARPLDGKVCLVAGAARGVGRGIALALGEAGATVIVTGRSTRFGYRTEGRNETVEDTAEDINEAGGNAYPYVCDHTDTRALQDLSGWLLRRHGAPDVIVSAIWGGNEGFDGSRYADGSAWGAPFWQRGLDGLERALETGAYAYFATLRALVPLMIKKGSGLIVSIGFDGEGAFLGDAWYDLGKSAILRATQIAANELAPHNITALHLSPGHVATERVIEAGHDSETTESPLYAGRAVAALAADADVARQSGKSLFVSDLAEDYDFTDIGGGRPGRFRLDEAEQEGQDP